MEIKIYLIENKLNGKMYVGQTVKLGKKFEKYYGSGNIIKAAINKYGVSSFKKKILKVCDNQKDADNIEIEYIKKLNTLFPNGYNIANGGSGNDMWSGVMKERMKGNKRMLGKKHSEETKRKIGSYHKGKNVSKESIEKNIKKQKENWENLSEEMKIQKKEQLAEARKNIDYVESGRVGGIKAQKNITKKQRTERAKKAWQTRKNNYTKDEISKQCLNKKDKVV
jgi:group I intron endonuclease